MKGLVDNRILKRVRKKGFNPTNKLSNINMCNFFYYSRTSNCFAESNIWDGKKIKNDFINKKFEYQKLFKILQIHYLIKTFNEKKKIN